MREPPGSRPGCTKEEWKFVYDSIRFKLCLILKCNIQNVTCKPLATSYIEERERKLANTYEKN